MNLNKNKENLFGFTKSGIYCITCLKNNKHYIGQSKNVKARLNAHKNKLRRKLHDNSELQKDFNLYGEKNFFFQNLIFGTNCLLEELLKLETQILLTLPPDKRYNFYINRHYIKEKNPFFGRNHTLEARRSQSLAKKGKTSTFKGHKHANKVKQLISQINSNKTDRRKPVILNSVFYESISEASEKTGYTRRIIRERCHNTLIKNFQWASS
jgi:hypothetical protein